MSELSQRNLSLTWTERPSTLSKGRKNSSVYDSLWDALQQTIVKRNAFECDLLRYGLTLQLVRQVMHRRIEKAGKKDKLVFRAKKINGSAVLWIEER